VEGTGDHCGWQVSGNSTTHEALFTVPFAGDIITIEISDGRTDRCDDGAPLSCQTAMPAPLLPCMRQLRSWLRHRLIEYRFDGGQLFLGEGEVVDDPVAVRHLGRAARADDDRGHRVVSENEGEGELCDALSPLIGDLL